MTIHYRSLFSIMAALSLASTGIISSSVEAWATSAAVPPPPAPGVQDTVMTPVVTYGFQAAGTGYNLGNGGLVRNYLNQTGMDSLVAITTASNGAAANVPQATWSCRTTLFNGFSVAKQTNLVYGDKTNTGRTAYAQGTVGPNYTYPRVTGTLLFADCN